VTSDSAFDELDAEMDEYAYYEELFDPTRGRRKPRANPKPRQSHKEIAEALADDISGLEGGFETSYRPSRYETTWLLSSLRGFYDRGLIEDVLALIKGGKEASVYRCQADPATGGTLLAAKVYRPTKFRALRNDSMYRQGRSFLNAYGNDHDYARDQRVLRAVKKKTAFGQAVRHTSWLMHEYTAMEKLYRAGAAVPQPVAVDENAILMSYHGDARVPASTLNKIRLERDEAESLLQEVWRNVALMLEHGIVHGDLSAFNILYWQGEIRIIDFPQVIDLYANEDAYWIFKRDIQRTCEYFTQQGVECDAQAIFQEFWYSYGYGEIADG
jgi:RIO kinase 1